jgi:hypothetical protein
MIAKFKDSNMYSYVISHVVQCTVVKLVGGQSVQKSEASLTLTVAIINHIW